jgi:hypothetical protein
MFLGKMVIIYIYIYVYIRIEESEQIKMVSIIITLLAPSIVQYTDYIAYIYL